MVTYFHEVLTREDPILSHDVELEDIRLEDQMEKIRGSLLDDELFETVPRHGGQGVRFSRLIERRDSRLEVVVTFLAILELAKLQGLSAQQWRTFSEIWLVAATRDPLEDVEGSEDAEDPATDEPAHLGNQEQEESA